MGKTLDLERTHGLIWAWVLIYLRSWVQTYMTEGSTTFGMLELGISTVLGEVHSSLKKLLI